MRSSDFIQPFCEGAGCARGNCSGGWLFWRAAPKGNTQLLQFHVVDETPRRSGTAQQSHSWAAPLETGTVPSQRRGRPRLPLRIMRPVGATGTQHPDPGPGHRGADRSSLYGTEARPGHRCASSRLQAKPWAVLGICQQFEILSLRLLSVSVQQATRVLEKSTIPTTAHYWREAKRTPTR